MTKFQEILALFSRQQVDFVLIGGLAMVFHGYAGATADLDIVYRRNPDNFKRLVSALSPYHVKLRCAEQNLPFIFDTASFKNVLNFTLQTDLGAVDLLAEIPGFNTYDEILAASESIRIGEFDCRILSIDGLMRNKRLINRPKDQDHLKHLEAIQRVKQEKV